MTFMAHIVWFIEFIFEGKKHLSLYLLIKKMQFGAATGIYMAQQ